MSVYMPHMHSLQSQYDRKHRYTYITYCWHIALKKISMQHHMFFLTALITVYMYTPHYCTYKSKTQQIVILFTMLLPYMCQQQICPSNVTYAKTMSVYLPHMNSLKATMLPEAVI